MKQLLIFEIDTEDGFCSECEYLDKFKDPKCELFASYLETDKDSGRVYRHVECLNAERLQQLRAEFKTNENDI